MLVEMLDREALVALAIKPLDFLRPVRRNPPTRRLAKPTVQKPSLAFLFVPARPAPECPLAHPEQLGRLRLVQLRRFPAVENVQKHRHAHPLKGFRPAHPNPSKRAGPTGQFVRYLNRTYRLLRTALVAVDGSKFKAVNNRDKNFTVAKVARRIEQVEASIARYLAALDHADRRQDDVSEAKTTRIREKIEGLRRQMKSLKAMERQVEAAPDKQISLTDPDARS